MRGKKVGRAYVGNSLQNSFSHLGIIENRLDVIHQGTAKTTLLEFLNPKRAHRHKGFIITNKDLSDTQKSTETKMAQIAIG